MNIFSKQKGSLLLDVVVSISIIALISTLSIPYLKRYQPTLKLNTITRELASDLRYAQQLTIAEQTIYGVEIAQMLNKYTIIKIDTATTTIKEVILPEDIIFENVIGLQDDTVKFNSYGGVNESGEINLININGKIATINIKPSGYIQLVQ